MADAPLIPQAPLIQEIAEEQHSHLTEPFYRVAEARERNRGGGGLGLAIAMQAIARHGDAFRFAYAHGGSGLLAEIELPLVEASPANSRTSTATCPAARKSPQLFLDGPKTLC